MDKNLGDDLSPLRRTPEQDPEGQACLRTLLRLGIPFRVPGPTRGIRSPVIVTGPLRGMRLAPLWGNRPALMDCRFALTLYRIAPVVRASGFDELLYSSVYSYRNVAGTHHLSRHAFGLAIDVFELKGPGGLHVNVKRDWQKVRGGPSQCVGAVTTRKARLLRRLVCALERSRILHQVLTPDSDYAHRDHLHISGRRPGERAHARYRWAGRRLGQRGIPYRVGSPRRYRRRRARWHRPYARRHARWHRRHARRRARWHQRRPRPRSRFSARQGRPRARTRSRSRSQPYRHRARRRARSVRR